MYLPNDHLNPRYISLATVTMQSRHGVTGVANKQIGNQSRNSAAIKWYKNKKSSKVQNIRTYS